MTLDHSSDFLRDRILAAVPWPLTDVGRRALDSFLSLPIVEGWRPKNMSLGELSKVFEVGLPFSLLEGNATAQAHRQDVGKAVGLGERAPPDLMSEVHAGALLSNWGANVKFVPRKARRTPDIEADWGDGLTLDVEVARGKTKDVHEAVHAGVESFVETLLPSDIDWNLLALVANASDSVELSAMFDAAVALRPGQKAEDPGRWYVCAVPLERRDEVVGAHSVELFGPSWWPSNEPSRVATNTFTGSTGNPLVVLRSLLPLVPYTNPILRKADSGQSSPGKPFLIALDVSQMPRAHERIVDDLSGWFKIWDHVTAVLLFESRLLIGSSGMDWFGRMEWVVSMHRNPSATIAPPPRLAELSDRERLSVEFTLFECQT